MRLSRDAFVWDIPPAPYRLVRELSEGLGVSEVVAQALVRRGYTTVEAARAFLEPPDTLHDPFLMAGMAAARERIDRAVRRGERIAVHGDYDADGITATFLLTHFLRHRLGAEVVWRLPNRFVEGYGLSAEAVDAFAADGVSLLVTVDCGITAVDEVARARAAGIDVVVTDHHVPEGPLPDGVVVSPRLGSYPCPDLAGVGVAFKLCQALLQDPPSRPPRKGAQVPFPGVLREYADVVAVGTVADVVPLLDENRVLVRHGLARLRAAPRPGLAALLEVSGTRRETADAGAVAYRLAPRLNAAGRLEDAAVSLDLLACDDADEARRLAQRLDALNRERQAIEERVRQAAEAMVPGDRLPAALVLSSPDWHEGVVGIVAGRLAERFHRPVILLCEDGDEAKGSGRSIPGFDLLGGVERCAAHLLAFGGHRAACGLRLRRERIAAFRRDFVAHAAAALGAEGLRRRRLVDAVAGVCDLGLPLVDELEALAPHGAGNREVTLLLTGVEVEGARRTRDGRHARLRLRGEGRSCAAVRFHAPPNEEWAGPGRHDVAVVLEKDEYNGVVAPQVRVREARRREEHTEAASAPPCQQPCPEGCLWRRSGDAFWAALLDGPPAPRADEAAAALAAARAAGRHVDRRGRPPGPAVAALVAGGERVLVAVADLAARWPLVAALPPFLAPAVGAVLPGACGGQAFVLQGGAADSGWASSSSSVVPVHVVALDVLAERPDAAAGVEHVVFVDPPYTTTLLGLVAAAAPQACLHAAWDAAAARATARLRSERLDLDRVMRHAWRTLRDAGGRLDDAVAAALLAPGVTPTALGAALRTLREAGLVHLDGQDGYHLKRPQQKVDVTRTSSHEAWHTRFHRHDFLASCLTARL